MLLARFSYSIGCPCAAAFGTQRSFPWTSTPGSEGEQLVRRDLQTHAAQALQDAPLGRPRGVGQEPHRQPGAAQTGDGLDRPRHHLAADIDHT
jgi:hypothetical protein